MYVPITVNSSNASENASLAFDRSPLAYESLPYLKATVSCVGFKKSFLLHHKSSDDDDDDDSYLDKRFQQEFQIS
jgi:hypothetical protein